MRENIKVALDVQLERQRKSLCFLFRLLFEIFIEIHKRREFVRIEVLHIRTVSHCEAAIYDTTFFCG